MRFSLIASVAGLLALTQAAPSNTLQARNSVNDCGDSTFENQTTDGSPLVTDCQTIVDNISGGGTWKVSTVGQQSTLVQFGTCALGVQGNKSANTGNIGNQDIMDLINESIRKFEWNGKVGAKGEMTCQSDRGVMGEADFTWGIYVNPDY